MENERIMRLQKFIALSGIASRRKSEELILQGKVKVNGIIVDTLGEKIDSDKDKVSIDGKIVKIETKKIYIMLNKPTGYVTTTSEQFNRPAVTDLVKNDISQRLYPVGRLDYDTEGLIILTNDGDLTYRVTHPKHEVDKEYIAVVRGVPDREEMKKFREGLNIEDYITAKAGIDIVKAMKSSCVLKITIHEGKNRQVRKMCEAIGHPVLKLKRVSVGNLQLGNLPIGKSALRD